MLHTCIVIWLPSSTTVDPPNDLVFWSLLAAIPLVIAHEGASGVYPGCTDLAYKQAISDGADVLDCPVQMTKDGTPICLGSINLIDGTTAAQTFSKLITNIPELDGPSAPLLQTSLEVFLFLIVCLSPLKRVQDVIIILQFY